MKSRKFLDPDTALADAGPPMAAQVVQKTPDEADQEDREATERDKVAAKQVAIAKRRTPGTIPRSELIAALESNRANLSNTAKVLGVSRIGLEALIREDDALIALCHSLKESLNDLAEQRIGLALTEKGMVGLQAAKFILESRAQDRGWGGNREIRVNKRDIERVQKAIEAVLSFVPANQIAKARTAFAEKMRELQMAGM